MAGVKMDRSPEQPMQPSRSRDSHNQKRVSAEFAPSSETTKNMSTDAQRKAMLANAALFGPLRK